VVLHDDSVVLLGLLLESILIVVDHFGDFLLYAGREGLRNLEGEAVLPVLGWRCERVESELLIILLVALRLLEGNRTDGEGKGGLVKRLLNVLLRYIIINRHLF
jgi:hypothetical protein